MESLALADLKKRNAAKLDAKNQEQLLEMGREVPGEIKPQEGKNFDAFHLELECVEKSSDPKYFESCLEAGFLVKPKLNKFLTKLWVAFGSKIRAISRTLLRTQAWPHQQAKRAWNFFQERHINLNEVDRVVRQ